MVKVYPNEALDGRSIRKLLRGESMEFVLIDGDLRIRFQIERVKDIFCLFNSGILEALDIKSMLGKFFSNSGIHPLNEELLKLCEKYHIKMLPHGLGCYNPINLIKWLEEAWEVRNGVRSED